MRRGSENGSSATNGSANAANGSSSPINHKSLRSGSNNRISTNGSSESRNGSSPSAPEKSHPYFGHNRQEVARLIIQALQDMGYHGSATNLMQESGFDLESPSVAALRHAVLDGEWAEAEALLFGTEEPRTGGGVRISNGYSGPQEGLPLAEGVDENELRFQLRRQKYLELLEDRDHGSALMVLRQELRPLDRDMTQLHRLSGLIVCPSAEELKNKADWDGASGTSRSVLLSELSKSISPSVMIPNHRLAVLLDQVKQSQISACLYHNPTVTPSLFADHACDKDQFPLQTVHTFMQRGQVWFLQFSPNGKMLATCGDYNHVSIYDTSTFDELRSLSGHGSGIAYVAWSPDSKKLVSCSTDKTAKLWEVDTGQVLHTMLNHNEPVTSAAWLPDGSGFLTGSLDERQPLHLWAEDGSMLYKWGAKCRISDLAVSADGRRLVTTTLDKRVFVYKLSNRTEEYSWSHQQAITSVNISKDSKHILINLADQELQLIDIDSAEVVQRFIGKVQGKFIIRSTFGGTDENLVLSGSEDGNIYIFHKERGTLIEKLEGHPLPATEEHRSTNAVAWNPTDPCMFASAGDDHKVKIWSKLVHPSSITRTSPRGSTQFR